MRILSLDLSKFKTVACDYEAETRRHQFVTVLTMHAYRSWFHRPGSSGMAYLVSKPRPLLVFAWSYSVQLTVNRTGAGLEAVRETESSWRHLLRGWDLEKQRRLYHRRRCHARFFRLWCR